MVQKQHEIAYLGDVSNHSELPIGKSHASLQKLWGLAQVQKSHDKSPPCVAAGDLSGTMHRREWQGSHDIVCQTPARVERSCKPRHRADEVNLMAREGCEVQ